MMDKNRGCVMDDITADSHEMARIINKFKIKAFDLMRRISNIHSALMNLHGTINFKNARKLLSNSSFQKIKLEEKQINENWDHLMDSHLQIAYSYERELNQRKS